MGGKHGNVTVIRGEAYDLTNFISEHPGGELLIRQAIGRDATALFESYHVRDSIVAEKLAKLKKVNNPGIKVESIAFPNDSEFYKTVKRRVAKEVLKGGSQRGGMEAYILTTVAVSALSYGWFIFVNSWASAVWLGFIGAHIGMTLNHCANHGGLFKSGLLNYIFGFSNDLIGASSLVWCYHHHISHHIYCNDTDKDQDVFTGLPFIRFDRRQPVQWYNKYQHLYIGFLFPLLFVTKHISDYKAMISHKTKAVNMIGATATDFFFAHIGKLLHFSVVLFLPLYLHGFSAIYPYLLHGAVGSTALAWLFAISHNLEETKEHTNTDDYKDWAIAQTEHSANYGGSIASFLTGGLNLQIEHHLFPAMAYKHYPAIAKIVKEECTKKKVRYNSYDYLPGIIVAFYNYIKNVGSSQVPAKKAK